VNGNCPRLVIAATGSGQGKTSIALGLVRALVQQGLRVQTFKVGPDFLDPTYLALASGRTCYNLDGWMTSRDYIGRLVARTTADADLAVIEGVMGLFDGAEAAQLDGSTAEIAHWLDAPVLLVVHAWGAARSLAATVHGFTHFQPGVRIAGVLANHVGSPRHAAILTESLAAAELPPLLGAIPRGGLPALASRHLGLVIADQANCAPAILDALASGVQQHVKLPQLLEIARSAPPLTTESVVGRRQSAIRGGGEDVEHLAEVPLHPSAVRRTPVRLGIARDAAFHFYYPDNLESLEEAGAVFVPFSPLDDKTLPADLDGLYIGGGYPELFAERLSANESMRVAVNRWAASGRSIYAECGGLMYLSRALQTAEGRTFPMAGVLPMQTVMRSKFQALGYADVLLTAAAPWGAAGATCRGHEFHYSEIGADDSRAAGWLPVYAVRRRRGESDCEGFCKGPILASYVHLHWASRPAVACHLVSQMSLASRRKESP
jgi:cobyrinic acid a,c-diamide synthase